jgi:Predicted metal-binding integral membrane protein (DUF2182)
MIAAASDRTAGLGPAYRAARSQLGLVAVLFAIAALAWWSTGDRMSGMDDGPWTALGTFGWFLGVWVVMMAAMMFPSVAPTVALYSRMTRERARELPFVFAGGYLLTWAAAGAVAYALACGRRDRRRRPRVGPRRALGRRLDAARGCGVRGHASQGRVPRQMPRARSASCSARGATVAAGRSGWVRRTAGGASAAVGR